MVMSHYPSDILSFCLFERKTVIEKHAARNEVCFTPGKWQYSGICLTKKTKKTNNVFQKGVAEKYKIMYNIKGETLLKINQAKRLRIYG